MTSVPPPGEQAPPPEDPWESARRSVHDDVAAALSHVERTCPSCGHAQTGRGRLCERCGAEMVARRPRRRLSRRAIAAIVLVLAAAIAGAVLVTKPTRRDARAEAARQRAQQAALEAAEIRRLRIDARPVRADGPRRRPGEDALTHRHELVLAAERLVTGDARARVRAGTIKGPVAGTQCLPYPPTTLRRDAEADPAATVGRYECVAYKNTFEAPEITQGKPRVGVFGTPFWVVIDYRTARLVWCKVTPRAGEGGRSLASVPVPEPCRDPQRKR
jgi:hypothetical protein